MTIGLVIKLIRKQKGLSQEALAIKASLSRSAIRHIESGVNSPSLLALEKISKALGEPVSFLFLMLEGPK